MVVEMKAYVLVNTELGCESSVMDALNGVEEIWRMNILYGVYDVLLEVEAEGLDRVKEIVFNQVRNLEHVKGTLTLLTHGEPVTND